MTDFPFPHKFERRHFTVAELLAAHTESEVQRDIIELLRLYLVDVAVIDAGGKGMRGKGQTGATGIPAGFADLEATLAPNGRQLYIEVKAPAWYESYASCRRQAGKASPNQLAFLSEKHRRGAVVMIAWSSDEVWNHLGDYLIRNKRALTNAI